MNRTLALLAGLTLAAALGAAPAAKAEGELFIYNWTDYTAPELIERFETETGVKVTLDTYDSNETLLAKLKSGATGYDIVVPTHNFVQILVTEGLLEKIDAAALPGYANIEARWQKPEWDPEGAYTIPWQWGTTSFTVDTSAYTGEVDSYKVLFEPPAELQGRIGMFNAPDDLFPMAQIYLGVPFCSESAEDMQKVLALLQAQKPHVKVYNSDGILERLVSGDTAIHTNWNGYSQRARKEKASLRYAYPKEGVVTWFDSVAVPVGAKNRDNALKFVAFMLEPQNAAIQSNFAGYSNGIAGSSKYMTEELKAAPEVNPPADIKAMFSQTCSKKALQLQDRVWTKLKQ
ncbi:MAG: extracellular solute-binding protein [Kiloniellales bacterium]|nr:extracellular solute-binding protein [Kiloniellales bacterium]